MRQKSIDDTVDKRITELKKLAWHSYKGKIDNHNSKIDYRKDASYDLGVIFGPFIISSLAHLGSTFLPEEYYGIPVRNIAETIFGFSIVVATCWAGVSLLPMMFNSNISNYGYSAKNERYYNHSIRKTEKEIKSYGKKVWKDYKQERREYINSVHT